MNKTNLILTLLFTNVFVLEIRQPSGFSLSDQVFVTNIVYAQVVAPALNATNSVALSTNVQRYEWAPVPLKPARKPLKQQDPPPLPPGAGPNKKTD